MGKPKPKRKPVVDDGDADDPLAHPDYLLDHAVDHIIAGFRDVWLAGEDGWVYIGPAMEEKGTLPKQLVCVSARYKNPGMTRARWVRKMFTTKGDVSQAVRRAKACGADRIQVSTVTGIEWQTEEL